MLLCCARVAKGFWSRTLLLETHTTHHLPACAVSSFAESQMMQSKSLSCQQLGWAPPPVATIKHVCTHVTSRQQQGISISPSCMMLVSINARRRWQQPHRIAVAAGDGEGPGQPSAGPPAVRPSTAGAAATTQTATTSQSPQHNGTNPAAVPAAQPLSQQAPSQPASSANAGKPAKKQSDKKTPMQQKILNSILGVSYVPYSSYVPEPLTFLHAVDARIKQIWLVALYFMIARAPIPVRVGVTAAVAAISMLVLPARMWQSQLTRLGWLCGFIFVMTCLGAEGVPLVMQPRDVPAVMADLPPLSPTAYHYTLLKIPFITVTHRSLNLAVTGAALTFCSLQAATLVLVTTPGEEMALALKWWLAPLRLIGAPVQEIALTLLLSLRFMSMVFEEVRNLCLGLAARGVDWAAQGGRGAMSIAGRLCLRLFANLFHRSENIAQAMMVRGFQGPDQQKLYMMHVNKTSVLPNIVALVALAGLYMSVTHLR